MITVADDAATVTGLKIKQIKRDVFDNQLQTYDAEKSGKSVGKVK